jgi:hypothetical protein
MSRWIAAFAVLALAACSPPASEAPPAQTPAAEAPAPAVDLGPYTGSWDAAEFSRFRHTLNAATPGPNTLTLQASTDAPGGETVAVYPVGPDGERRTVRLLYVVADRDGTEDTAEIDVPAEGLPVEVVIENAGGRQHAGTYTLSVGAAAAASP